MSSKAEKKIIAVIGGTGAMGRPVLSALSETGHYTLRVLTRDANSEQAKQLAEKFSSIEFVEGDYADEKIVRKLLTSAYGVFCNTDIWSCGGFKNEVEYGKTIFNIAKELSVKHFVYSSLDHTEKLLANETGDHCWHYDGKALVAEYIESHDARSSIPWTILTTAPYFENFQSYFPPTKDPNDAEQLLFTLPIGDHPMVYIALDDIAWFVKYAFENPEKSIGKNFYIAGETLNTNDLARIFTEVTGIRARYNAVTLEEFLKPKASDSRKVDFDVQKDFIGFYNQFIYEKIQRDYDALRAIHPGLLNWRQWLEKTGWKGEKGVVQTSKGYMEQKK